MMLSMTAPPADGYTTHRARCSVFALLTLLGALGCERPPAAGSFRVSSADVYLGDRTSRSIQTAIVTKAFFTSTEVVPVRGSLLPDAAYELDPTDGPPGRRVVVSERLVRDRAASIGSCGINTYGICHTVVGVLPESFDTPPGTVMWTAADHRAIGERRAADRRHIDALILRSNELCAEDRADERPVDGARAPVLVAMKSTPDVPGFDEQPLVGRELKKDAAPNHWFVSTRRSLDASGRQLVRPEHRFDFAGFEPRTLACVAASRTPVTGRTMFVFSSRGARSESVYTVQWSIHAIDWATGRLVARRSFRATPAFKARPDPDSARFGLAFGEGDKYGDPSTDAWSWIRELVRP